MKFASRRLCEVNWQATRRLIKEVNEGEYPFYEGQVWADPNMEQAANYMRRLVEDDAYRAAVAKAGCSYIKTYHNPKTVGENYRSRLMELGLLDD